MREVIYISNEIQEQDKPVEFTHNLYVFKGWNETVSNPNEYEKVIYCMMKKMINFYLKPKVLMLK